MSFFDKRFGEIFPVRTGVPAGTANERQILDAIGGSEGFRTRIQKDATTGIDTMLRTKNGMPQFSNLPVQAGEDGPIFMDSGAIDVGPTGPLSAERFDNAILHYGTTQRLYQSMRQLLGKLFPSSMICDPPDEGVAAASFLVSADQLGVRDQTLLDLLYEKKLCAAYAPASLFCGKARLYMQSQYGTPTSNWRWSLSLENSIPELASSDSGIKITTNSGVYLDSEFQHWLISMDNLGAKITRLKRDSRVIPLVKRLSTMSSLDSDFDKVEAYILAYSVPDQSNSFWISIPGVPVCDMFGYGWKFNWNGSAADIINTEIVPLTGTTVKYSSTHYRVEFYRDSSIQTVDEKSRWSASLSTIEGPVDWKSDKWGQVIASPIWGEYTLGIFGELWGDRFGDAPVYCFYKRNALEVIRCSHSEDVSINEFSRTSSPSAWGGIQDWSTYSWSGWEGQEGTIGLDGGSGEKRARTKRPVTAGFYSSSVSAISTTQSYTYDRSSVSQKTYNGEKSVTNVQETTTNYYFNDNNAVYTTGLYADPSLTGGVPCYIGGSVQPGVPTDHGYAHTHTVTSQISIGFRKEYYSGTHSESSNTAIIIPFNDAESVYLWSTFNTHRSETGRYAEVADCRVSGGIFITEYHWQDFYGTPYAVTVYGGGSGFHLTVPSAAWVYGDSKTSDSTSVTCNTLITSSGSCSFTPTSSMSPFFAGEPVAEVTQQWMTGSSVDGVIYGEGARVQKGFQDFDFPPNFIGWA